MANENEPLNPFEAGAPVIDADEESLVKNTPGVAARPGKTYIMLGVVGLLVVALIYSMFSGDGGEAPPAADPIERTVPDSKPIALPVEPPKPDFVIPPPPDPKPETAGPQAMLDPDIPVIPPPIERLPDPSLPEFLSGEIDPKADAAAQEQALARLRSNLFIVNGGAEAGADGATPVATPTAPNSSDPNAQFAQSAQDSTVERVTATRINHLGRTIAQGRIIQATLETAINTDLAAPIRAIVSVDTYGEAGKYPLIPKGSRLIGTYNTTLTSGQTRVFVIWSRVIRPDGVDVQLGSPLIDAIGQAGVAGQLDTRFQEIFARSLVSSAMNIAMAIGSEKVAGGETTTTTSTTGTQTSGDTATTATTNALNRLGSLSDSFIQRFISVPPTILVDQGSKVNVIVNKDLYFPEDAAGVRIIN